MQQLLYATIVWPLETLIRQGPSEFGFWQNQSSHITCELLAPTSKELWRHSPEKCDAFLAEKLNSYLVLCATVLWYTALGYALYLFFTKFCFCCWRRREDRFLQQQQQQLQQIVSAGGGGRNDALWSQMQARLLTDIVNLQQQQQHKQKQRRNSFHFGTPPSKHAFSTPPPKEPALSPPSPPSSATRCFI